MYIDTFGTTDDNVFGYGYHAYEKIEFCNNPQGHRLFRCPLTLVGNNCDVRFVFNRFSNSDNDTGKIDLNYTLNCGSIQYTHDITNPTLAYIDSFSANSNGNEVYCNVKSKAYISKQDYKTLNNISADQLQGPYEIPNSYGSTSKFFNMIEYEIMGKPKKGTEVAMGFGPFIAKVGKYWDNSPATGTWEETLIKPCYKESNAIKDSKKLISGFGTCDAYSKKIKVNAELNPENKWDQCKCYLEGDTIIIDIHNPTYTEKNDKNYFYIGDNDSGMHIFNY